MKRNRAPLLSLTASLIVILVSACNNITPRPSQTNSAPIHSLSLTEGLIIALQEQHIENAYDQVPFTAKNKTQKNNNRNSDNDIPQQLQSIERSRTGINIDEANLSWQIINRNLRRYVSSHQSIKQLTLSHALSDTLFLQQNAIQRTTEQYIYHFWLTASQQRYEKRIAIMRNRINFLQNNLHKIPENTLKTAIAIQDQGLRLEQQLKSLHQNRDRFFLLLNSPAQIILDTTFTNVMPDPNELVSSHKQLMTMTLNNWSGLIRKKGSVKRSNKSLAALWQQHYPNKELAISELSSDAQRIPSESWFQQANQFARSIDSLLTSSRQIKSTKTPRGIRYHQTRDLLIQESQDLLTLAVMTQLRIALLDYAHQYHRYHVIKKKVALQQRVIKTLNTPLKPLNTSTLLEHLRLLTAELDQHTAFAQLQQSLERLHNSLDWKGVSSIETLLPEMTASALQKTAALKKVRKETLSMFSSDQFVSIHLPADISAYPKKAKPQLNKPALITTEKHSAIHTHHVQSTIENTHSHSLIKNDHKFGILLLKMQGYENFVAHRLFSGLTELPYRTHIDNYDQYYSIYYQTYSSRKSAEAAIKNIPDFYKIFSPKVSRLKN